MSLRKALILGLATFLLVLVFVLPAGWVGGALPEGVQCGSWSGSIWRGGCRDMKVMQQGKVALVLSELRWKLRAGALLRLTLAAEFHSWWPQGEATGDIELRSGGNIRFREGNIRSQVDRNLLPALPRGWSGHADVKRLEFDWINARIERLGGEFLISDLADSRGTALGSYHLEMPTSSSAPFTGQLRDAGGPVEVAAQLHLSADRSWNLEGRLRARDATNERLNRQLDMLGSADIVGWRPLSAAGTFN